MGWGWGIIVGDFDVGERRDEGGKSPDWLGLERSFGFDFEAF